VSISALSHSPPLEEGWSLTNRVAECVLEPWLVSDHYLGFALPRSRFAPVCGRFGGFATFINAAATPPLEEGNAPTDVLKPWVWNIRRLQAPEGPHAAA
jgi:hypothetical protein